MASFRSHEGYLLIDHRASPGTTEVPEGQIGEWPVMTCSHCNAIVRLNVARTRPRGYCRKCDHYVCDSVGCNADCNPITEGVELALRYPELGAAFLARGPHGEVLFDTRLRDRGRTY